MVNVVGDNQGYYNIRPPVALDLKGYMGTNFMSSSSLPVCVKRIFGLPL